MATGRTIARNSVFLGLAFAISKLFSIGLTAIAGRVLGTVGFGVYATGAALVEVGRIVASAGLDYLVAREVASAPERAPSVARHAAVLKVVGGVLVYLILIGVVAMSDYPPLVMGVVLIVGTALFFENLSDTLDALFQGVQRMHVTTVAFAVSAAFVFVSGAAALLAGLGVLGYAACFAGGFVVRFAIMTRAATRDGLTQRGSLERHELGRMLRASVPLLGATVLAVVFHRMDLLMLGRMASAEQVGLYAAAVRIIDVVVLLPRILATAVFPALRRQLDDDPERLGTMVADATRVSLVLCSVAGLAVWVLAPLALRLIPGVEFLPATDALRLMSWGIVLQGGAHMIARLLLAIEAERDFALVAAASLVTNLGLNLLWIPRFGIEGAATATLVSYAINVALYFVVAARRGRRVPLRRSVLGPLGAGVAAFVLTRVDLEGVSDVQHAALVAVAWILTLSILGGVRRTDVGRLRDLVRRVPNDDQASSRGGNAPGS